MVRTLTFVAFTFAAVCAARPVQKRNPQDDRPGFFPEITSLFASLAGDGQDALISAIYGDTAASSAFAAATSAAGNGDAGAAESYWNEATEAVGSQWSHATDAAVDNWTSYTSAYDANNGVAASPTTSTSSWSPTPEPVIPTTSSALEIPNASASQTGAAPRTVFPTAVLGIAALTILSLIM